MTLTWPVTDAASGWGLDPDAAQPVAALAQAVLTLTAIDEISGEPPSGLSATTTTPGVTARVAASGAGGLIGRPSTLYTATSAPNAALQIGLSGPGYLPQALSGQLGLEAGFPAAFTPAALGTVYVHRTPVTVSVCVISRASGPLSGATVSLDGLWATTASLTGPAAAPDLVCLDSPLYAPRGAGASVAQQNLTPAPPAQAKTLQVAGNVGDASVVLPNWNGVAVGAVLGFDTQDPGLAEYPTVTAIIPLGLGADYPASVALAFPLARPHAAGGVVTPMVLSPAGAANPLGGLAQAGDMVVLPTAMTGLDGAMTAVVVSGGGAADEHHTARLAAATTGAGGYGRLPPVQRLAQLNLRAHHPSQPTDLVQAVMPPFGAASLTVTLSFP